MTTLTLLVVVLCPLGQKCYILSTRVRHNNGILNILSRCYDILSDALLIVSSKPFFFRILTFSSFQTNIDAFANSAKPDETARHEPCHRNFHCLPCCYRILTENPICNNGCVQIHICESPLQKLRVERVKSPKC